MFWFSTILILHSSLVLAQINIHHRIFHPVDPVTPFANRGTIDLASRTFTPSKDLADDLIHFSEVLHGIDNVDAALYQVALEHPGDSNEAQWDISSVKACHLPGSTYESIILHVKDSAAPFAIDYFVSPIPHSGSCPSHQSQLRSKSHKSGPSSQSGKRPVFLPITNSSVTVQTHTRPPLPILRVPPPLTPEGNVVVPVPEKTFVQKYWMYLAAVCVAILLAGGGEPEEEPRRSGASGGGK